MTWVKWVMLLYGVAMIAMGLHGYIGSGSVGSLAGGGGAGAIVLVAVVLSLKMATPRVGYILASLVSLGMVGMFAPKFANSGLVYPHLTIAVISGLTVLSLVGGHIMAKKAKNSEAA